MRVLGGYLYWKVVLEFWFGHPKCHFRYPQNSQKHPFWAFLGAPKMALGVPESKFYDHFSIQIPPLKPPFRHFGNHFGPRKSDFWPFYFFGHFPIEIPMHLQICIFRPQGVLKSKKFQKKPTLKFNFTLKNMLGSSSNFKLTFRLKSHWALVGLSEISKIV